MTNGNPKLFISYSWSNQDHEKWVINLANELVENGILHKIPTSPFGSGYSYDSSSGKVWSPDFPDY